MRKVSIRKRIKETMALLLSVLMIFATLGSPLQSIAAAVSVASTEDLVIGTLFMEGDTLSIANDSYAAIYYSSINENSVEGWLEEENGTGDEQYVTGDSYYYSNPTFTFTHRDFYPFPEAIASGIRTVYQYGGARLNDELGFQILTFVVLPGFTVQFQVSGIADQVCVGEGKGYDFTTMKKAPSASADATRGALIGWSTIPNYGNESTDGMFFAVGDDIKFTVEEPGEDPNTADYSEISTLSGGVMKLYPVYEREASLGTMKVELSDYTEEEASRVTNPAPTGYTGSNRTFSWKYFETDEEGNVADETVFTTTPPTSAGYYKVEVTAAQTDVATDDDGIITSFGYPEETASANFKVTGVQDSIVFNPENKTAYYKAFGTTLLVSDLVTGIKGNATLHFQMDCGGTVVGIQQDHYPSRVCSTAKIKIYTEETDLYEAYESEWYDLPYVYLEWPAEKSTVSGEKVEGVTINGYDLYKGPATVIPPDGYTIINDYEKCEYDGLDNPDGVLVRNSDGAETSWGYYLENPIWIDIDSPNFREGTLTIDGVASDESLSGEDTFAAKEVTFDIYDNNFSIEDYSDDPEFSGNDPIQVYSAPTLKSVTVNGEELPADTEYPNAIQHITLKNDLPTAKTFEIVALDFAGHEGTWSVTLSPALTDTPDPAYIINGTEGNRGYYRSDVTLQAPTGYTISATDDDPESFVDEIDYDNTITQIRLKKTSDGSYTAPIDVEEIMIDKDAPEISLFDGDETAQVVSGKVTITGNAGLFISIEDGNSGLLSATVNGESLDIVDETMARLQIFEDKTDREVVIAVEDKAGNTDTLTITLAASTATAEGEAEAVTGLVYDGTEKELVTAKNVQNGTIMYSATKDGYYSETVPTGTAATTYTVWYKVVGNAAVDPAEGATASKGYLDTTPASLEITIAPLTATLSWGETEFDFDGEEHCPTAVVSNLVNGDTCMVTVTGAQTAAGTYTATATALSDSNYALPAAKTTSFTIGKASATIEEVPEANTLTYDGTEQELVTAGTASQGSKIVYRLGDSGDFTDTIPTAKAAGTYSVTYKAVATSDNYEISPEVSDTVEVVISPLAATLSWSNTAFDYDGEEHCPTAVVSNLVSGDTCTVTVTGTQTAAGTYTATATALSNSNYALPAVKTTSFTIGKASTTIAEAPVAKTLTYDGTEQELVTAGTAAEGGKVLYKLDGTDADYAETIPTAKTAGTYSVSYKVVATSDNYVVNPEVSDTVEVVISPLTATLSWNEVAFEFDGDEHCPEATVGNLVSGDTCTVTVTGAQTDAGTYTATATELSNLNYALPDTKTTSFTIGKASATIAEAPVAKTLTYDGTEQELVTAGTASEGGKIVYRLGNSGDYTDTIPTAKNAGTYTVSYKAVPVNDNYEVTTDISGSIEVVISPVTVGISWENIVFFYDGEEHSIKATAMGLVTGDTCTVKVSGSGVNVGTYTATAISLSNSNYALPGNVTQTFSINPKDVFFAQKPAEKSLTYNGEEQQLVTPGSATQGGKVVYRLGEGEFSDAIPTAKKAGEYTVLFTVESIDANHAGGAQGSSATTVIAPKALTLSWSNTAFTYDGNEHVPTATLSGVCGTDDVKTTVSGAKTAAGTYTATVSFSGADLANYTLPGNVSVEFTISQKPVQPVVEEKKTGTASVTMSSFIFGGKSTTPVVSSTTNDATKASIAYKPAGAGDDAYNGTIPTAAGTYTVRAILPENENYKSCVAYGSLTVSYLPVPDGAYVMKGTVGNDGWYTSEVQLKPAAGYEISVGNRNSFSTAAVTLTEDMAGKTFFIRNTETGEQTAGITVTTLKIDTDTPELVDMEDDGTYYGDDSNQLLGTAKDKNLHKVYVDGVEVKTSTDENGNVVFELPLGKKRENVNVRIVDEAGNEKKISLTTAPGWMKTGEVGEGEYYLETNYAYKMPKNGVGLYVSGRPTKYMPGVTFFAKKEGTTEFSK